MAAVFDQMQTQLYKSTSSRIELIGFSQWIQRSWFLQKISSVRISTIEPDSFTHIIWTTIMICMIILLMVSYSVFIAFQDEVLKNGFIESEIIIFLTGELPLIAWLGHVIIHLNTAFYKRGLIQVERWSIFLNYLRKSLWLDSTLILLYLIMDLNNIKIMFILSVLLLKKLEFLKKDLEDAITLQTKEQSIYELGKLCLYVLIIAHFCGCVFWSVGIQSREGGQGTSWIENENLLEASFTDKYINSLYWATVTMLTVGYGDIHPYNSIEKLSVIIIMIFSCGVYAYSLSQIGVLIQMIPSQDASFKRKFSPISLYMKKRNLQVEIQNEVKRYYQYLNQEQNDTDGRDVMLNPLNLSLRQKVLKSINLQLLQKYKMFSLHFSGEFLQGLALMMHESEYMPDDTIWDSSLMENDDTRLFFVVRGQIRQLFNDSFMVRVIEESEFFNEKCFIMDKSSSEISFISTCVSTVVHLRKRDFLKVIQEFPKDYEIYCKLRDEAKNQDYISVLNSKCETCENYSHDASTCPQVNFRPFTEKILFKHNISYKQERRHYPRSDNRQIFQNQSIFSDLSSESQNSDHRHYKALVSQEDLVESIIDYMIDMNPLGLDDDHLISLMKEIVEYNEDRNLDNASTIPEVNNERQRQKRVSIDQLRQFPRISHPHPHRRVSEDDSKFSRGKNPNRNSIDNQYPAHSHLNSVGSQGPKQQSTFRNQSQWNNEKGEIPSNENIRSFPNESEVRMLEVHQNLVIPTQQSSRSNRVEVISPNGKGMLTTFSFQNVGNYNGQTLPSRKGEKKTTKSDLEPLSNEEIGKELNLLKSFSRKHQKKISSKMGQYAGVGGTNSGSVIELDLEKASSNLSLFQVVKRHNRFNTVEASYSDNRQEKEESKLENYSQTSVDSIKANLNGGGSQKIIIAEQTIQFSNQTPAIRSLRQIKHGIPQETIEEEEEMNLEKSSIQEIHFSTSDNLHKKPNQHGMKKITESKQMYLSKNHPQKRQSGYQRDSTITSTMSQYEQNEAFGLSNNPHLFSQVPELDKACIFQHYFPYNNLDRIIVQLSVAHEENLRKQRKDRKSDCNGSKLEKFMRNFNQKRGGARQKTRRFTSSPLRLSKQFSGQDQPGPANPFTQKSVFSQQKPSHFRS